MLRKLVLTLALGLGLAVAAQAQRKEIKVITTVESVVPGGLGRSRMISTDSLGTLEETKMENFFSLVGINFGNIKDNDQTIATKMSQMLNAGWRLENVNSGVYSADKSTGIFITRYIFVRERK